jgi:hypothetical protein
VFFPPIDLTPRYQMTEETKNSKTPYACIKKGSSLSYCERRVDENTEFMFKDGEYAIRNYTTKEAPIGVCDQCVHACKVAGVGRRFNDTPLATRGIDKTKM